MITHPAPDQVEFTLPRAEALLGATMALMTGHAQHGCQRKRAELAGEIEAHFCGLERCASLSLDFRNLLHGLRCAWAALCGTHDTNNPPPWIH